MARSSPRSPRCRRSTARGCTVWSSGWPARADSERLDLYLSLLLGLIERLIRFAATGEGATQEEQKLAKRLVSPRQSRRSGRKPGRRFRRPRPRPQALNLDRGLLVLETWFRLQQAGAGTSCLAA